MAPSKPIDEVTCAVSGNFRRRGRNSRHQWPSPAPRGHRDHWRTIGGGEARRTRESDEHKQDHDADRDSGCLHPPWRAGDKELGWASASRLTRGGRDERGAQ